MATLYMTSGIPGSGKSHLTRNLPSSMMSGDKLNIIESDDVRQHLLNKAGFPDVWNQNMLSEKEMMKEEKKKLEKEVWEYIKENVITVLRNEENVILVATNTQQWILEEWFNYIEDLGHKIKVIVMSTPLDICIERNEKREKTVPKDVMQNMYNNFILTIGWLYMEHNEKIINSIHL